MSSTGLFSQLDTVLLRVRDFERSKAWYENILGITASFIDPQDKLAVFDLGSQTSLTLWELKRGEALSPPGFAVAFPIFRTTDAHQACQHLLERGVQVERVQHLNGVSFFGFFDPDGNRLEARQG